MSEAKKIGVWGGAFALAALTLIVPVARAQGVHVALQPVTQTVAPGDTFTLTIQITQAGDPFNAFDAYVGWDPAALTFLQRSPISLQEGAYFASACANRFHKFQQGADRDTITDVLLCSGVSLTGPGPIYRLLFRASMTPQVTTVRFLPGLRFYNEGLYVNPVQSADAAVGIGMSAAVGSVVRPASLRVSPNPAHTTVRFAVETHHSGPESLEVCDLLGRRVRRLQSGSFGSGSRAVVWDGRDEKGARVPPGVYLGRLRTSQGILETRFTLLR